MQLVCESVLVMVQSARLAIIHTLDGDSGLHGTYCVQYRAYGEVQKATSSILHAVHFLDT